jgi:hypothetical protein
VKNNKITKKLLATTTAGEKISTIIKNFDTGLAKFENNQILLNKISCRFLVTTKLLTG